MSSQIVASLIVCATVAALAFAQDDAAAPPTIHWRTDLAAARADAAEKGRPLMVVFR